MVVRSIPIPFIANLFFVMLSFTSLALITILHRNDLNNHIISKR